MRLLWIEAWTRCDVCNISWWYDDKNGPCNTWYRLQEASKAFTWRICFIKRTREIHKANCGVNLYDSPWGTRIDTDIWTPFTFIFLGLIHGWFFFKKSHELGNNVRLLFLTYWFGLNYGWSQLHLTGKFHSCYFEIVPFEKNLHATLRKKQCKLLS